MRRSKPLQLTASGSAARFWRSHRSVDVRPCLNGRVTSSRHVVTETTEPSYRGWRSAPALRAVREWIGKDHFPVNVSRKEQRVLHALAQGGRIDPIRNEDGKIEDVDCFTREGWRIPGCDFVMFRHLHRKRLIASIDGGPYRISRRGLTVVRPRVDNR